MIFQEWHNGPETLLTFVMVTTPPNALISRITDRMPATLPRETWATWLGEMDASLEDVKALLRTFDDGGAWTMEPQQPSGRHGLRRRRGSCSSATGGASYPSESIWQRPTTSTAYGRMVHVAYWLANGSTPIAASQNNAAGE